MTMEHLAQNTDLLDERVAHLARYLLALRKIQDKSAAMFLASLGGLNIQQLNILNIIGDNEPCTMSAIAKQSSLSLSSITLLVDKLVKAKLVNRSASLEDRRIVYAHLSEEGKKIYQVQIKHVHTVIRMMLAALTSTEQENLIKIFKKLTQGIEIK